MFTALYCSLLIKQCNGLISLACFLFAKTFMSKSRFVLLIIILSQFLCTSLWFAGNGVIGEIILSFDLGASALGNLTSFVQFGFIVGTLIFAVFSMADRYSPSKVFMISALLGGLANLFIIWGGNTLSTILIFRFFTGFFLAGIYPVGMKIAADYFDKGLGKSLGLLVGALVLGTALPHLLKGILGGFPWQYVIVCTTMLAFIGGVMMYLLVPDGPYCRTIQKLDIGASFDIFKLPKFRFSAFGYFGHMWELYAFWTFVPFMLSTYTNIHGDAQFNIPLLSFVIIGLGALSCAMSAYLTTVMDAGRIAFIALFLSATCCFISPFMFELSSSIVFILFLLIWGMSVIADSPMFSTLVAQNAPSQLKGTALTLVNSIGFFVSILSIEILNSSIAGNTIETTNTNIFLILAIGPVLGLISLLQKQKLGS